MKVNKKGQRVEAGEVGDAVKKAASAIDKFFSKVGNWLSEGEQTEVVKSMQEHTANQWIYEILPGDADDWTDENTIRVLVKYTGGTEEYEVYDLYMKHKGAPDSAAIKATGLKLEIPEDLQDRELWSENEVKNSVIQLFEGFMYKECQKMIEKLVEGVDSIGDIRAVESSREIKVTLQKVTSSSDVSIELVSVNSSYSTDDTLDAITTLVSDDTFVAGLPEGDASTYSVSISEDGYDVDPCTECEVNFTQMIDAMLSTLYNAYAHLAFIGWNARGHRAEELSRLSERMRWDLTSQIDQLSILEVRLTGYAAHPLSLIQSIDGNWDNRHVDYEEGVEEVVASLKSIIDVYELYWCNFSHEDQSRIESWIGSWKQELEYHIGRQLDEPILSLVQGI